MIRRDVISGVKCFFDIAKLAVFYLQIVVPLLRLMVLEMYFKSNGI